MEKVVDHSNPSKALDLSEIRFQLMYVFKPLMKSCDN